MKILSLLGLALLLSGCGLGTACNQNEFRQYGLIGCAVRKAADQTASKMPQQILQEKVASFAKMQDKIMQECKETFKKLDVAICMAKRIPTMYEKSGFPHSDLIALYWAKMLVISEKVLNRKITMIEMKSQISQLDTWLTDKQRERDRQDALIRIQNTSAQAQMRSAQAQERSNALQVYQGILRRNQPRQPINCHHRGNSATGYRILSQTSCW